MTQNVLIFNNQTPAPVQFILYLRDSRPSSSHASVVWQQMFAPPKVPAPLAWMDDWAAAFASVETELTGTEIFSPIEIQPTALGRRWQIRTDDDKQQLFEQGLAPDGYIEIANASGKQLNPGIGLFGNGAVYIRNVYSGATASFKAVDLDYWLALPSLPVQTGQVVDEEKLLLEPVRLSGPIAAQAILTGPPLKITVSHTIGDALALLREARRPE